MLPKFLSPSGPLLAALLSALLLTSCQDKQAAAELAEVEEHLEELQQAKTKLETTLKTEKEQGEKRQRELLQQNEALQKSSDEIKAQFEQLEDDVAKAKQELRDYKSKYKLGVRTKLKGMPLPRLETTDRVGYQSLVVREVTPEEVSFSHSGGIARVPLAKLPRDLQQKFLYEPEEVKAIAEAKAAATADAGSTLQGEDMMSAEVAAVKQKDPTREVNPIVVMNLKNRIVARQQQIQKTNEEAAKVKKSGFGDTQLGKYRLQILGKRVNQLQGEIRRLLQMLNKELNGQ